jgi:hypothetical protein
MEEEKIVAVDERQVQTEEDGGSPLDPELIVAEDETEPLAVAETTEIPPASNNVSGESAEDDGTRAETSLRGSTGPRTLGGKNKSRLNAVKHGIFTVGIIPSRESESDYLGIVEDLLESIQPEGRLEELLVEKLAMLMWRYRRLLKAEAAEVAQQTQDCAGKYKYHKYETASSAQKAHGLINSALIGYSEVALEAAILSLKAIRQRISEIGLDWERDRQLLCEVFGPFDENVKKITMTTEVTHHGRVYKGVDSDPERVAFIKYYHLTRSGKDPQEATEVQPDAAELVIKIFTEEIERFELMLQDWRQHGDDGNEIEETRWLVPAKEASDRLQRYEASLERSFDRTLSQIERLQRMRLGQPVLPAIKVDVSH